MSAEEKSKLPADFQFPAMVKSLQASGSLSAHDMAVVWSAKDIDHFTYPLYVQEYINHDGTIFKIYVLGEHNFTVTRVSLPNFAPEYQAPVQFNSQDWKHELPPDLTKEYTGKRKEPTREVVSAASQAVSQLLGLSLFGFDMIENVDTGRLAIIDVNYFPGACFLNLTRAFETDHTRLSLRRSVSLASPESPELILTPFSSADYRGVSDIFGKLLAHLIVKHNEYSSCH
jgi:glutathione synthase/RimK-type ligase-like ATP-grasp enzyme